MVDARGDVKHSAMHRRTPTRKRLSTPNFCSREFEKCWACELCAGPAAGLDTADVPPPWPFSSLVSRTLPSLGLQDPSSRHHQSIPDSPYPKRSS